MKMNGISSVQGTLSYISQQILQKQPEHKKAVKDDSQEKKQLQENITEQIKKKNPFLLIEKKKNNKNDSALPKTEDTPGQLAVKLANAKTPLDVQEVMSKATMILLGLKMRQSSAEGKEKIKLGLQIRRMEKLLRHSRSKIRHLNKESDLERKQRAAEKQKDQQEIHEIYKELKQRRSKRKNDENNYAKKEIEKDMKELQGSVNFEGCPTDRWMTGNFTDVPITKEISVEISTSVDISI